MDGITDGLFELFERTEKLIFRCLLGKDLAQRGGLVLLRVVCGGILWGASGGTLLGLYLKSTLSGIEWGSSVGLLLALVLAGLSIVSAVHERNANAATIAEN